MKKTLVAFLAIAVWMTLVQAKEPSKPRNFSGNWVLNFGQTKNPPDSLQGYNLVVNQDEQQLKVETTLQGDLQGTPNTPNSGGYPGGSGRRGGMGGGLGIPGGIGIGVGIPVGMGVPGVGMGIPRGGGGRSRSAGPSQGNVAAYKIYPENVVYKLDGSEGTAQLRDQEQTNATSKAERAKNGEVLKLSLVGRGNKVQITEQWKLSEDRKSLKVDRTVKSPEGSGTVHLVFLKRESDTASAAALLVQPY